MPYPETTVDTADSVLGHIEILSASLLNDQRPVVQEMRETSERLNIGLGWHYLLDLTWAAKHLSLTPGMRVMDAGAGQGLMQWWLAEQGIDVISVDRTSRACISQRFRETYRIMGLREKDVASTMLPIALRGFLPPRNPSFWKNYPDKLRATMRSLTQRHHGRAAGTVYLYNQDLRTMTDVQSNSVDAIVSISALEHNPPEDLRECVSELMRVLNPGSALVATLAAARDKDWFHEPSKGWCYTEQTLRDIFNLPMNCPSNYGHYDELLEALVNCTELRDSLSNFYFKSGANGMPWGIWDPKYQPVGVVKVKPLD
jgi:ubiquinone/menaquinone biosynthesis C-methylase UbiE